MGRHDGRWSKRTTILSSAATTATTPTKIFPMVFGGAVMNVRVTLPPRRATASRQKYTGKTAYR